MSKRARERRAILEAPDTDWTPAPLPCPHCGAGNNGHMAAGPLPAVPHDGDLSLCAYCGRWAIFEGGGLRKPNAAERADIAANPDCKRAQAVVVQANMERGNKKLDLC